MRKTALALAGLLLASIAASCPARAENALFTFKEMVDLQSLPLASTQRALGQEELVLYQNMEFYVFTVFESLQAASNAALMIHGRPLFCAPIAAFRFEKEGDIIALAQYLVDELTVLTEEIGSDTSRYGSRPASEVLLLGLRAAFPCEQGPEPVSALR